MNDTARYTCKHVSLSEALGIQDKQWKKASRAPLVDVVEGTEPTFPTFFQWLRDDQRGCFYLRFEGKSEGKNSNFKLHDEPLWKQDVFELFLCDEDRLDAYRELQSSPWDVHFDGRISYDEKGKRHLDMSWDAKGWTSETLYLKENGTLVSQWVLPYEAFANRPQPGTSWRFGIFRVVGQDLQAWQMTGAANFHVPQCFGFLDFE